MKDKSEGSKSWTCAWWIHICNCTPVSNMRLKQKIGLSIASTHLYSSWIISKIHRSIFYSLKACCTMMLMIKHSILPSCTSWMAERSRGHTCLKLITIMSIFQEKVKMSINMHVNNDRSIVDNIMMQILKVLYCIPKFFDSLS